MKRFPRISVVTPSLNQAVYLEQTIKSVLNQDYPNLEYIIIDGGSTDGSVDIIKRYEDRLSYWISEPDEGMTRGLIKGFDKATGEIQCWINSDDLLEPGALRDVADYFDKNPGARVVTGDALLIDADGALIRKQRQIPFVRFFFFYDHNYITQSSTFWRRELYERVGGLDTEFHLAMDADLFIRFADLTTMHHRRKFWSRFRIHANQLGDYSQCNALLPRLRLYPDEGRPNDDPDTLRKKRLWKNEMAMIRNRYIKGESGFPRLTKQIIARTSRVALKFVTGCYLP